MNHPKRALLLVLLAACAVVVLSGCARPKTQAPPDIIAVGDQSFASEVIAQPGVTLVLFSNAEAWQSQEMSRRYSWLADAYRGRLKFCSFAWDLAADPAPYRLEILPTLVMYRDGYEVDRMRGIPDTTDGLRTLNDDLELWVLRTGLQLMQDPKFQARFVYQFHNTASLTPVNEP
ncbi:thioredoxin family protein [Desulfolutivibrio sulfoxidireducens]|uniref:thioredoxin family protein n=1 Tax=Desulfolutivibrio sulfoxidireducens TaxID=2773299 RepID=UPI00159D9C80|nr:thioredoxin family protein [Desulfolutivibrio sulfoxidireducens]QLA14662.1 hypothetical protein GD605_00100 [Desulfolutivibrio sulfoxidireducens]QLA18243.1 hypothetical protein GD604_00100 [Desulfolutivibrio sulfoxidireducens]